jgi:hypothetical protein
VAHHGKKVFFKLVFSGPPVHTADYLPPVETGLSAWDIPLNLAAAVAGQYVGGSAMCRQGEAAAQRCNNQGVLALYVQIKRTSRIVKTKKEAAESCLFLISFSRSAPGGNNRCSIPACLHSAGMEPRCLFHSWRIPPGTSGASGGARLNFSFRFSGLRGSSGNGQDHW